MLIMVDSQLKDTHARRFMYLYVWPFGSPNQGHRRAVGPITSLAHHAVN